MTRQIQGHDVSRSEMYRWARPGQLGRRPMSGDPMLDSICNAMDLPFWVVWGDPGRPAPWKRNKRR